VLYQKVASESTCRPAFARQQFVAHFAFGLTFLDFIKVLPNKRCVQSRHFHIVFLLILICCHTRSAAATRPDLPPPLCSVCRRRRAWSAAAAVLDLPPLLVTGCHRRSSWSVATTCVPHFVQVTSVLTSEIRLVGSLPSFATLCLDYTAYSGFTLYKTQQLYKSGKFKNFPVLNGEKPGIKTGN
jgi:hypothetical protein